MKSHETNEMHIFPGASPKKSVRVEGPGADQTHVVANKLKGDAIDTVVNIIKPLGEQDGR